MKSIRIRIINYFLRIFTIPNVKNEIAKYAKGFLGEASRYSKYPSFDHNGPLVAYTEHPNTTFLLLSGKPTRVIDHGINRKRFGERNFQGETEVV